MSETYDMPIWTCQACQKEQQYDEYYDLESGSTMTCQYCDKEYRVAYIETTMSVTIEAQS